MSMIVPFDELQEITGKKQSKAVVRELRFLKVPYALRRDGKPVVYRKNLAVIGIVESVSDKADKNEKSGTPNFGALEKYKA